MIDYIIIPFLCHIGPYWSLCYIFYLLDRKYLDNNHINWKQYNKAAFGSLMNQITIYLPMLYLTEPYYISAVNRSTNDTVIFSVIKIFCIINFANLLFYLVHRLLHTKYLFRWIHYIHHEFIEPIAVASLYAHPMEHLFANTLAFFIPFFIIGSTYIWSLIFIIMGTIITILSHANYKIISSHNDHIVHHKLFKYNFGFGGYIDIIFNTYKE